MSHFPKSAFDRLAPAASTPAAGGEVAGLLRMVIADMDTCCGELGADYEFKELSTETVEAIKAYQARKVGPRLTREEALDRFKNSDAYNGGWQVREAFEAGWSAALTSQASPAPVGEVAEPKGWRAALEFYAQRSHFAIAEEDSWDTVSGEPQNFWCDEAGTATVEDGTVAAMALAGTPLPDEDDEGAASPAPAGGQAQGADE